MASCARRCETYLMSDHLLPEETVILSFPITSVIGLICFALLCFFPGVKLPWVIRLIVSSPWGKFDLLLDRTDSGQSLVPRSLPDADMATDCPINSVYRSTVVNWVDLLKYTILSWGLLIWLVSNTKWFVFNNKNYANSQSSYSNELRTRARLNRLVTLALKVTI